MGTKKLEAGGEFPSITVSKLGGGTLELGSAREDKDWQMVVVYRGKHCPMCTEYLGELKEHAPAFAEAGIDVVAVSADTEAKAQEHIHETLELNIDVGFGLSVEQMEALGLFISPPRSPKETDRPFAEPGLFVVNEERNVHVIDVSNNPFVRPDLKQLLRGLRWIRKPDNHYPIRGTHPNGLKFS
ncbi:MAG: redoxin domain-containing protein [Myxococcota bacterium]